MAVLSASEKLKILALGKATLKEINELEAQAADEPEPTPEPEPQPTPQPEPTPQPNPQPTPEPQPDEPDEPDEKDLKIAELEKKLKEAQEANVHKNIGGSEPSFDEQLDDMFKGYRF